MMIFDVGFDKTTTPEDIADALQRMNTITLYAVLKHVDTSGTGMTRTQCRKAVEHGNRGTYGGGRTREFQAVCDAIINQLSPSDLLRVLLWQGNSTHIANVAKAKICLP